ncbi:copper amine oxidase N-terminal domain-containing protein [Paenibacillus chondroitinus]|uniref:Copper amine oxidase N-terminal domain-containing protein n=1 Tax=Paenibacillus chondroitinus TaxID=59842 RepID=A0ABU6DLV3_9BACL|nr:MULTISPECIES: copper amine oxidase N-terminal domain-containing protein [Paenibacillus]MCY9660998.1 copper amine oxidase N-terminal domain-containing protein [Paenibacillus anseongense]MEB4797943.1 copper amine oxidase N-terminal domain-containing protein [Paenibacillus chondroitinus]
MNIAWFNPLVPMRKMIVCLVILQILTSGPLFLPAYSLITELGVEVNGEKIAFADVQPYIDEQTGSTMVPAREIAEKLGAEVEWDRSLELVTFRSQHATTLLTIGQKIASVDGKQVELDSPAVLKNDRTMVPLRAVSESLGADVDWVGERNLVLITSADKAQRSTWIWDSKLIETDGDRILQFAADQKLTFIYVRYETYPGQDVYRNFIRRASGQGIKVEALAGKSDWIYEDNHIYIRQWIAAVTQYNASVGALERFQGFHFDIEPYTLDMWKSNQTWVLERWMDTIRLIESEVKSSDRSMTMAFDIPFWINSCTVPGSSYSFSAWLLEKADTVVIMAYRNTALGNNGIIARAKSIILEAATLKKQAVIAVDTLPSTEADYTTFYKSNSSLMESELKQVKESLSLYPSYIGIAVHDYVRWIELLNANR